MKEVKGWRVMLCSRAIEYDRPYDIENAKYKVILIKMNCKKLQIK